MLETNPHYPSTTPEQAKQHILALIPIGHKNQFIGLLNTYKNSLIKEMQSQDKSIQYPPND